MADKYYTVASGRKTGIFTTWDECKEQVHKFPGAVFKSFENKEEALEFLQQRMDISEPKQKSLGEAERGAVEYSYELMTDGQKYAYDTIMAGKNVFLTGGGGVGKSYLLKAIIAQMENEEKQVVVCAPTGTAAIRVNGATIHSTLKLFDTIIADKHGNLHVVTRYSDVLELADIVIVDEISMCRMDLFDALSSSIKRSRGDQPTQFIVVGDFFQLPPVVKKDDKTLLNMYYKRDVGKAYAFMSDSWKEWNFVSITMNEIVRQQDVLFIKRLRQARMGNLSCIDFFNERVNAASDENAIYMCGRKADANAINEEKLSKIEGREKTYNAVITGKEAPSDMISPRSLTLKEGARVMATINDPDGYFQNGSMGTVTHLGIGCVKVEFDNGTEVDLYRNTWNICEYSVEETDGENGKEKQIKKNIVGKYEQIPLMLAYAVTIHKAQGATYPAAVIQPDCWDTGQLYVALSRVKTLEGLSLASPIKRGNLRCDEVVMDFYKEIFGVKKRESA